MPTIGVGQGVTMAEPVPRQKIGATPGKLLLVATLAIVLILVVVIQSAGEASPDTLAQMRDMAAHRRLPRQPIAAADTSPVARLQVAARPVPSWPEMTREDVLQYDPFAMSAAFAAHLVASLAREKLDLEMEKRQEENERRRQLLLAELREQGVTVVLRNHRDLVAQIGVQTVRVGDVIDGFRVVEISPKGVTLEVP